MKEVYMCRPCAEKLKTEGKDIIIGASVREKQTCSVCNRRRFVYLCTHKRLPSAKSDKFIIRYIEQYAYHGELREDTKFILDNKGNFKEYTSQKRAEAAAKKIFKNAPSVSNYEIIVRQVI